MFRENNMLRKPNKYARERREAGRITEHRGNQPLISLLVYYTVDQMPTMCVYGDEALCMLFLRLST